MRLFVFVLNSVDLIDVGLDFKVKPSFLARASCLDRAVEAFADTGFGDDKDIYAAIANGSISVLCPTDLDN